MRTAEIAARAICRIIGDAHAMTDRTACKYCGKTGFVRRERVVKGGRASDAYYCGACNRSWEQLAAGAPSHDDHNDGRRTNPRR
jgi:hypothetical protein